MQFQQSFKVQFVIHLFQPSYFVLNHGKIKNTLTASSHVASETGKFIQTILKVLANTTYKCFVD